MLNLKYIKETEKEHAHTEVRFLGKYLGYIMKSPIHTKWYFDSDCDLQYCTGKSRKDIIDTLEKYVSGTTIVLQQHFSLKSIVNIKILNCDNF